MLVVLCATTTLGCNLAKKIADLKADKEPASTAASASAAPSVGTPASSAATDESAAAASASPADAPSAAASTSAEPTPSAEATKPEDIIPACSKEVGVDRARTLWRDCLKASADRAPESLQKELCFANQFKSCSALHHGIQGGCLTGEAPGICQEYLNRLIDVRCNIKTTDWKNHRYPQGFFKIPGQDDDNFWEFKAGKSQSQTHRVTIDKVLHGDLDGDGSTEALVGADVQPNEARATVTSSMVAVFEGDGQCNIRHRDSIAIVHGATTNVITPPVFSVESDRLVGIWEEFDPAKTEDLLKIRTEWTLKDNKLKEVRKKVNRVKGGNGGGAPTDSKDEEQAKDKEKDKADETKKPDEAAGKDKEEKPSVTADKDKDTKAKKKKKKDKAD